MRFDSVAIKNFKSIGEYEQSKVIIEPDVTAIIGKNESGKSNIIEALSYLSFKKITEEAFQRDNINRNNAYDGATVKYIVVLKSTDTDKEKYNIQADTIVTIDNNNCIIEGGAEEYYKSAIFPQAIELCNELGDNPFRFSGNELNNYRSWKARLSNEKIDVVKIGNVIGWIGRYLNNINEEKRSKIEELYNKIKQSFDSFIILFPTVFYRRSSKILHPKYTYDQVNKEFKTPTSYPNSLLCDFVRFLGIKKEDFLIAVSSGEITGKKTSIRERIQKDVDRRINKDFRNFYTAESVELKVRFDNNCVCFSVQTGEGETLLLSERSNGLRWYLNTFIDARANDVADSNVLFLLDEPGTSMHVNAQKEIMTLFNDLAEKHNQVVYTTHSPYMLNLETGIGHIRAVDKDDDGYTYIYNTAYDSRIASNNQKDTFTPIINALGMNLHDTFGPAKDKMNIVIEGMSDYFYLSTMAKMIGIDSERFVFIPSVGASNCINICCVLQGWGCPFIAVFDYDKEGVESGGNKLDNNMYLEYKKHYCYIKDVSAEEIDSKTYNSEKCVIEDIIGRDVIQEFVDKSGYSNFSKTLTAKLLTTAVTNGDFILPEQSIENISSVINRIVSYVSSK